MSKGVKFTVYPFVKRQNGIWITKGIIRDDQAQDWVHYDYDLPLKSTQGRSKAELGAVYELASTAALVLPTGLPVHVTWRFSSQEAIDAVPGDIDLLIKLASASTSYSLELMEPTVKAVADLEASSSD